MISGVRASPSQLTLAGRATRLPTDFCFIGHNETYILQYESHHP